MVCTKFHVCTVSPWVRGVTQTYGHIDLRLNKEKTPSLRLVDFENSEGKGIFKNFDFFKNNVEPSL